MKPSHIPQVLDLARKVRKTGGIFNPLFVAPPGVGKSFYCQKWAKDNGVQFIDFRGALAEAPDLNGFPYQEDGSMKFALPSWLPKEGTEGLLLLDEVNRASNSVMNALMQLLTDRKIGTDYILPDGWIIAACINPDSSSYSVNSMDSAFYNRFDEYIIKYDHKDFVEYIEGAKWHGNVVAFIKSGIWLYNDPDALAPNAKYVSPRTWSKINVAEQADLIANSSLHLETSNGVLGDNIGMQYHKFTFEITPVLVKDIVENEKQSFDKLKRYSEATNYRGDLIGVTVDSIVSDAKDKKTLGEAQLIAVAKIIPADQTVNLLQGLIMAGSVPSLIDLTSKYPELKEHLRYGLRNSKKVEEVAK